MDGGLMPVQGGVLLTVGRGYYQNLFNSGFLLFMRLVMLLHHIGAVRPLSKVYFLSFTYSNHPVVSSCGTALKKLIFGFGELLMKCQFHFMQFHSHWILPSVTVKGQKNTHTSMFQNAKLHLHCLRIVFTEANLFAEIGPCLCLQYSG